MSVRDHTEPLVIVVRSSRLLAERVSPPVAKSVRMVSRVVAAPAFSWVWVGAPALMVSRLGERVVAVMVIPPLVAVSPSSVPAM